MASKPNGNGQTHNGQTHSELTSEEQRILSRFCEYQRTKSVQLRDELVLAHSALVEKLARQYMSSGEPVDDLMQEGYIGLIKAVERFDPDKGVKFTTFATHIVSGEIRHYLRDLGKLIQEPGWHQQLRYQITREGERLQQKLGRQAQPEEIAKALGIETEKVERVLMNSQVFQIESLDAGIEEDDEGNTGTRLERIQEVEPNSVDQVENRMVLRQALAKLPRLQRTVVFHFFYQDLTKTEIARKLGISVNYASYLVKRALKNLRIALEESAGAPSKDVENRLAEFEQRVQQTETVDVETSLPTAATFHRQLQEEVLRARRYPQEFCVVFFKIVGWDDVKSPLSQRETENVLRQFTNVLRRNTRSVDKLYRYDEHSFLTLLPHTGANGKAVGDRVRKDVQESPLLRAVNQPVPELSVVYRHALFPVDGNTPEELVQTLLTEEKPSKKRSAKSKEKA